MDCDHANCYFLSHMHKLPCIIINSPSILPMTLHISAIPVARCCVGSICSFYHNYNMEAHYIINFYYNKIVVNNDM